MSDLAHRLASMSPKRLALLALELEGRVRQLEAGAHEPIAIVGMSGRFPGAPDLDAFWRLLRSGTDAIAEVPDERWDVDALFDPDPLATGRMSSRWGGFLDDIRGFDAQFFGISPREALAMDPQQRLLLEVSWEALEDAAIAPDLLQGAPVGVFTGICNADYTQVMSARPAAAIDAYMASGSAFSIASGRLAYVLGLQGPAVSIDTACSSSLVAVHFACQSLRRHEVRMAIASGVNVICHPRGTVALSKSRMLAADGRCKTFDAAADGFVRGEGCGVIVLKRLADARADGDRIRAIIRGTATNQDGRSGGLTAPNGTAQEAVIRQALADAQLDSAAIEYVEAHGTGTALGDPIEVRALGAVLGVGRPMDRPLRIGSVKTNVGHLEAAAGIAGLIKTVLALQHEEIPPHLHFHTPNPHIDWSSIPVSVTSTGGPWHGGAERRRAGVSAFGFSGTNAHVILEDAPVASTPTATRSGWVLPLSAKTPNALAALVESYRDHLLAQPTHTLAQICQTAAVGRAHLEHRLAISARTTAEVIDALRELGRPAAAPAGAPLDVAFVFTGQGAQHIGMARELYDTELAFRSALDACAAAAHPHLTRPLLDIVYGAESDIDQTQHAQPALFAVEYALASMWRRFGIHPVAVLGHSLGEYVAACVAGVFSLEDAMRVVCARGRLMQALPPGGAMRALFTHADNVRAIIAEEQLPVSIAAENASSNTVISGPLDAVSRAAEIAAARGINSDALRVSHAFHSALMEPMLEAFERELQQVTFGEPRLPVISNVTGQVASASQLTSPRYWRDHVRRPVLFGEGVRAAAALGCHVLLEIGPHPTLSALAAESIGGDGPSIVPSLRRTGGDWFHLSKALAALYMKGASIDWRAVHRGSPPARITLPTYPFQHASFWPSDVPAIRSLDAPGVAAAEPWRDWLYELQWQDAGDGGRRSPLSPPSLWSPRVPSAAVPPVDPHSAALPRELDALVSRYIVEALSTLDDTFTAGGRVDAERLAQTAGVLPRHARLLRRLVAIVDEDAASGPLGSESAEAIAGRLLARYPQHVAELRLVRACGTRLAEALTGRVDPMDLLYPDGSLELTEALYAHAPAFRRWNALVADVVSTAIEAVPADRALRVLEIGAGTGATAAAVLPMLAGRRVEYWFTDISRGFGVKAADKLAAYPFVRYETLDIERDPMAQGFAPSSFDLVIASNVLHATARLRETTGHVRRLLAPGGLLVLLETLRPQRFGDITVGLTDGWWRFTDPDLRPAYPLIDASAWCELLERTGFDEVVALPPSDRTVDGPGSDQRILVARASDADVPAASAEARGRERWLIVTHGSELASRLQENVRAADGTCAVIVVGPAGTDYRRLAADSIRIDAADASHLDEALRVLLAAHEGSWTLVDARAAERPAADPRTTPPDDVGARCMGAVNLLQRVLALPHQPPARVVLITHGAQPDASGAVAAPSDAALWGLGRSVQREHPELHLTLVDLQTSAAIAEPIWMALQRLPLDETQIALRDEGVEVLRLARRHVSGAREALQLNPSATYLVTGGVSGLGLRVARWTVERGARHLMLLGRRAPDDVAREAIGRMHAAGAVVTTQQVDVSDAAALATALAQISAEHPLRGVFHAAGETADAALLQQSPTHFSRVLGAKAGGSWNLHTLTLGAPLDWFVLFSSGASMLGSPGQSNHGAANAYLDAFAAWRRAIGLPALSVSWGPWREVGAALRGAVLRDSDAHGLGAIDTVSGLAILERAMLEGSTHVAVLPIDWTRFGARFARGQAAPILDRFGGVTVPERGPAAARRVSLRREALAGTPPGQRGEIVRDAVVREAARVLGLEPGAVAEHQPLQEMGLDSLMAVELRNGIGELSGQTLPATLLFNYPTVAELSAFIESLVVCQDALPRKGPEARPRDLDELSEEELVRLLESKLHSS